MLFSGKVKVIPNRCPEDGREVKNVRPYGEQKQINVGCFIRLRISKIRYPKNTPNLKMIIRYYGFIITTSKMMTIFVRIGKQVWDECTGIRETIM